MKINNIICTTDFSDSGDKAIDYAADMAFTHGATLHLMNVIFDDHGLYGFEIAGINPKKVHESMVKHISNTHNIIKNIIFA